MQTSNDMCPGTLADNLECTSDSDFDYTQALERIAGIESEAPKSSLNAGVPVFSGLILGTALAAQSLGSLVSPASALTEPSKPLIESRTLNKGTISDTPLFTAEETYRLLTKQPLVYVPPSKTPVPYVPLPAIPTPYVPLEPAAGPISPGKSLPLVNILIERHPAKMEISSKKEMSRPGNLSAGPSSTNHSVSKKAGAQRAPKVKLSHNYSRREHQCLALAIYFEARSEPVKGQLAVAKVILNRVESRRYPNTICGVVFQGKHRFNSCQFSFACDGQKDYPANRKVWVKSNELATAALIDSNQVRSVKIATHYHADYVNPRWAKSMKRLAKIGRHIFYNGI